MRSMEPFISAGKFFLFSLILSALLFSQNFTWGQSTPLPSLAETKAAAEQGDAIAQDKLGNTYAAWGNHMNALIWYRKAAAQGIANSQYNVARLVIGKGSNLSGKVTNSMYIDEALNNYVKSANQDNKQAQLALGQLYEDGKYVKQDYVEAYKWYSLAHKITGLEFVAKAHLDPLILKMTQDQITLGQKKMEIFLAGGGRETPEPSFVKHLSLGGISGAEKHRLAIINGRTFETGEDGRIKIEGQFVKLRCLEIKKDSAIVKAEGMAKTIELKLK
jgi:tetratricopeptide (TPR) repeat protein